MKTAHGNGHAILIVPGGELWVIEGRPFVTPDKQAIRSGEVVQLRPPTDTEMELWGELVGKFPKRWPMFDLPPDIYNKSIAEFADKYISQMADPDQRGAAFIRGYSQAFQATAHPDILSEIERKLADSRE